jgi:hypothetical protein
VLLPDLPATFAATRDALHAVAEHVLAPARHRATGRIGLQPTPGGFGTPPFGAGESLRVEGTDLVHRRDGAERRAPLTTLGEAARFAAVPLGAPPVYAAATPADPDRPLALDAGAADVLAGWYAFAHRLLRELCAARAGDDPSDVQLWPEHFDLATDLGDAAAGARANYGASPGDGAIAEPYLYVGPWDAARRTGPLGTHPWGTALTYRALAAAADPVEAGRAFFASAASLLARPT